MQRARRRVDGNAAARQLAKQAFVGGETPYPAAAQTVGIGLGRSKTLYFSRGVDCHSLRQSANRHAFSGNAFVVYDPSARVQ